LVALINTHTHTHTHAHVVFRLGNRMIDGLTEDRMMGLSGTLAGRFFLEWHFSLPEACCSSSLLATHLSFSHHFEEWRQGTGQMGN